MKLIVFSDSHGSARYMKQAAELHPDADLFLHLGDGYRDFERLCDELSLPHEAVRGNCDLGAIHLPAARLLELAGCRILMTHGHEQGVKSTLAELIREGRVQGARLILFGHTHIPLCSYRTDENGENGIHLLNPGSITYGRSYGIVRIGKRRGTDGREIPEILTSTAKIE